MARKAKRECDKCHKANSSPYPVCNGCRAEGCPHIEWHYDSGHAKVCDNCGTLLTGKLKHCNFKPGVGLGSFGAGSGEDFIPHVDYKKQVIEEAS